MFSKSCKYAIRAVLYLALNTDEGKKIGVEEIAKNIEVPRHFLAKTLQQFTKKNLISSTKGPFGGFYLTEKNKSTNLYSVIEVIDGVEELKSCVIGLKECTNAKPCPYHHIVQGMRSKLVKVLKTETIIETAQRVKKNKNTIVI